MIYWGHEQILSAVDAGPSYPLSPALRDWLPEDHLAWLIVDGVSTKKWGSETPSASRRSRSRGEVLFDEAVEGSLLRPVTFRTWVRRRDEPELCWRPSTVCGHGRGAQDAVWLRSGHGELRAKWCRTSPRGDLSSGSAPTDVGELIFQVLGGRLGWNIHDMNRADGLESHIS